MKDYLEKLIKKLNERKTTLVNGMIKETEEEKRASIGATLEALEAEIAEAKAKLAEVEGETEETEGTDEARSFNPLATFGLATKREEKVESKTGTMEYRNAFMNYVQKGTASDLLVKREAAVGEASDLGVLLPETVVQEIIKGVEKVYGQLYSRVKKTNVKGGVKYPIGSFDATFVRVTEKGVSDRQNAGGVTGSVVFTYNVGEIRIATTLLQSVLSVPAFEAELAKVIVEAYVKAMDAEIMTGSADNNECEGILTSSRIISKNVIEFTADDIADWTVWQKKLFAKIPLSMRSLRPEFVMTANTYEANIETLKDNNNQPVAREIFNPVNGDAVCKFKGRDVVLVEDDILKNFDEAANGEYFGMYWVPEKAYAVNTNLEFYIDHYFDKETNQYVDKAIVINDGKILDPKYIYLLKKKA